MRNTLHLSSLGNKTRRLRGGFIYKQHRPIVKSLTSYCLAFYVIELYIFDARLFWINGWSDTDILVTIWVALNITTDVPPPIKLGKKFLTLRVVFSTHWNYFSKRFKIKKHLRALWICCDTSWGRTIDCDVWTGLRYSVTSYSNDWKCLRHFVNATALV